MNVKKLVTLLLAAVLAERRCPASPKSFFSIMYERTDFYD